MQSIRFKVFVLMLLIGAASLLAGVVYTLYVRTTLTDQVIAERHGRLLSAVEQRIANKKDIGLTNAIAFSANHALAEAMRTGNRELALDTLNQIGELYRNNSNFKGIKIHLHTADRRSFVRSWNPDQFGDDLSSVRPGVAKVNRDRQPLVNFELGRSGLMIRAIVPVFDGAVFVGTLEFLQGVGSVSRDFEGDGGFYLILLNDKALKTAKNAAGNQKVGDFVVMNDKYFSPETVDFARSLNLDTLLETGQVRNERFFAGVLPVADATGAVVAYHVVGEPIDALQARISEATGVATSFLVLIAAMVVFTTAVIFPMLGHLVITPVKKGLVFAEAMASGDLSATIDLHRRDELGELASALNHMAARFGEVVGEVRAAADQLGAASREVDAAAQTISQAATQEASSVEQTSEAMERLNQSVHRNTNSAHQTEEKAIAVATQARHSGEAVARTVEAMQHIAEKITFVEEIAYKTNLLSLNAAIEAARAGEQGKGFSVVAAEVRKLAESSRQTALDINALANDSVAIAEQAGQALKATVPTIEETATAVRAIAAASREQADNVEQINRAVSELERATQQNAAVSEQLAATAGVVLDHSGRLQQDVAFFRLESAVDQPVDLATD